MERRELTVEGRRAIVWCGGSGESLVLLHGAWGGAEMHWAPVWRDFEARHRVIGPEFPGLAYESPWVPHSFDETVGWLEHVLDATETAAAWIVGNSFGAGLAARFASRHPERCRGLVLVDGGPPPHVPAAVKQLLRRWPLRPLLEMVFRRSAYSAATLERGFADSAHAPGEVRALVAQPHPRQLEIVSELFLGDDRRAPLPGCRTLVVWGRDDRLTGTTVKAARRLQRSLPNAELVIIDRAGHLPQVERPDQFVTVVLEFTDRGT
jgi:pimeloyl-ACP methyl ester carboxylesterase